MEWQVREYPALPADKTVNGYMPDLLDKLLFQRGLDDGDERSDFLAPNSEGFHDPFLMDGMDVAAERIENAVKNRERILVYGDYDVDGVSATSILVRFFARLGLEANYYIPDRVDEGYGISELGIAHICEGGYDLLITVDCGITARVQTEEIFARCRQSGRSIDIIITDHHQWHEDYAPRALALLNPHIPGNGYPFRFLCGAGVALKLVHAVGIRMGMPFVYREYLDLAALATVSDIVSLTGENRRIVRWGLEKINKEPIPGIRALVDAASVQGDKGVDAFRISFALAPRINAAGRMGDAKQAVKLFVSEDGETAQKIAVTLSLTNTRRQEVQDTLYLKAVETIEGDPAFRRDRVLVVGGREWHHGVLGIVASKLVERYHKPAFVLSLAEEKAIGSGRSVEGFNLFKAMEDSSVFLMKFGGHEQAGGITLLPDSVEAFRRSINQYAEAHMDDSMLKARLDIHLQVEERDLSLKTAKRLGLLEPCGCGNPVPLLLAQNIEIRDKKKIGNNRHLRLQFLINGQLVPAVYFNSGDLETHLYPGARVDLAFYLEINYWQGKELLQLRIADMRLNQRDLNKNRFLSEAAKRVECLDCEEQWLYNGITDNFLKDEDVLVNRDDLAVIYRYMQKLEEKVFSLSDIFRHARLIQEKSGRSMNYFKLFLGFLVFDELEIMSFSLDKDGRYSVEITPGTVKVDLGESELLSYVAKYQKKGLH